MIAGAERHPTVIAGWWCVPPEKSRRVTYLLGSAATYSGADAGETLATWAAMASAGTAALFMWRGEGEAHGLVLVRPEAQAVHCMAIQGRGCIDAAEALFDGLGAAWGLSGVVMETPRAGLAKAAAIRGWTRDGERWRRVVRK